MMETNLPSNPELRNQLLQMQSVDQEMRQRVTERLRTGEQPEPHEAAEWEQVDRTNTARMRDIIAQYGWPGFSLVGADGASAAWLLVQHADLAPSFQATCLALLEAAVEVGQAEAKHAAYLTDRIRVGQGQPQLYGTQMHAPHGELEPQPIEEGELVDQRRLKVGLGPLAEYIALMKQQFG